MTGSFVIFNQSNSSSVSFVPTGSIAATDVQAAIVELDFGGYIPFDKTGDTLTGTAGSGFFGAIPQSSAPSTPGSGFRIYANASGLLEWKGTNGFTQTFDGSANTANRAYTLPNSSGTIAVEGSLTTFANPSIQNGYYQFVQTTAPTERSSGVPLVAGDRWYKPIDNNTVNTTGHWIWNGAYWISDELYTCSGTALSQTFTNNLSNISDTAILPGPVLFTRTCLQWESSLVNVSNYWQLRVEVQIFPNNALTLLSTTTITINRGTLTSTINTFNANTNGFPGLRVWVLKVGSPGPITFSEAVTYRRVHP